MRRDDAWEILVEHSKEERTRKHGIAVEAVMRAYARALHEDEEKWGITGLLHDFVADFQDVVREWNVACEVPVDGRTVVPVRSIAS